MKFIQQYKNLSKEIYILFFGRVVTSMGSLIWPLLTLILKNKLGYNATTIATITMAMSILQFPMLLLGGKLADTMNRKKIIVCCDMVTVISYIICGLLPLSGYSIALFYLAGVFATIEGPSYDALVADLSDSESREKAYSLQYLGMNLGLVLSPTIAGFLFENYLGLAFIITGIATFSSTLLIILFVKQLRVEKKKVSEYEEKRENEHVSKILWERRPILIYALVAGFGGLVYAQFNYLLPLNMETLYGAKGSCYFWHADKHKRIGSDHCNTNYNYFCRKNNRCPKNSDWRKPDYFRIIRVSVCTGNHAALFCADGYFYSWRSV